MNQSPPNHRHRSRSFMFCAAFVAGLALLAWMVLGPSSHPPAAMPARGTVIAKPTPSVPTSAAIDESSLVAASGAAGMSGTTGRKSSVTPVPPLGIRGTSKLWLRAKYGAAEGLLGYWPLPPGGEGESRTPQGFVVTKDGDLLVLDSEKMRLVWFGPSAQIKRTMSLEGLEMPADVAVAADGTIVVMDHEGVQTKGTLLLSPEGKAKGMLPQSGGGMVVAMHAVGNDIFGSRGGSSIKLGDTSGVPSHEAPALYDQDGIIPGEVAPDGRTILDAGIESREEGRFFVSALRDNNPPKHLFTRQYTVAVERRLRSIPYLQADNAGTIYVVLGYDDFQLMLVCFDSAGEPLGSVAMAKGDAMTGRAFKQFAINREQGGLVYHRLLEDASSYEIYDCR